MIPRAPSLFHLEEGMGASTPMVASGELVGLRLIIQPSPREQPPTVLRRSEVRTPATSASKCHENGRVFVGLEFLKCCFCCRKTLDATMDVFVYKGDQAFCSAECRCQQIAKEERREMEILVRKRRDAFHSRHAAAAKMQGSNRHMRLQTAAR
ncbi:FCS-Like Zinc finger 17-like [Phragmites australis]|uniref:FCS-Like Zinc finger 17-like n=1 Tax=Phragmites australis TaxID=29695 RepID=UPI002D78E6D4|nr:FCS-Like Zinc finger 17-like [Phragmites australis]